jgi:hypothetical protein
MLDGMPAGSPVELAIARGVAFLERTQRPSGEIPVLASGKADPSVFPTALAAHSLSFASGAEAVRSRALDFLAAEMDSRGLWRHWPAVHPHAHELPPDLDDTSCASAALATAGRPFPGNREMLVANRTRRGLFKTWKLTWRELRHPLTLLAFFYRTSAKPNDVDAVVNANVLHYLGPIPETRAVAEHLLEILRRDREVHCDKWYDNPFVVWYFFARALHRAAPEGAHLIERKLTATKPGSALEHALAACARHYLGIPASVDSLLELQMESGAWPAAAVYHGGRRRLRDGTFAEPHPDTPRWGSEELTTAFCIEALARAS